MEDLLSQGRQVLASWAYFSSAKRLDDQTPKVKGFIWVSNRDYLHRNRDNPPVGRSWRMDETYLKISGQWKYLYRAVDRDGDTVDFLLRARRDHAAARAFFERAIDLHDVPEKITIDKSGTNTAAISSLRADSGLLIEMRQSKYLNNIVKTTEPSNESLGRCSDSSPFAALESQSPASRSCT